MDFASDFAGWKLEHGDGRKGMNDAGKGERRAVIGGISMGHQRGHNCSRVGEFRVSLF